MQKFELANVIRIIITAKAMKIQVNLMKIIAKAMKIIVNSIKNLSRFNEKYENVLIVSVLDQIFVMTTAIYFLHLVF